MVTIDCLRAKCNGKSETECHQVYLADRLNVPVWEIDCRNVIDAVVICCDLLSDMLYYSLKLW